MILAWMFVLVPLLLFLVGYLVETIMSFKRLTNNKADGSYLDATWEVTHTFLVVAVAMFVGLFSNNLNDIADAAFIGMFTAATFVGLRGVLYIYIFYIRTAADRKKRDLLDWAFACTHVGILTGLLILLIQLIPKLFAIQLDPNTEFIPWMWPGLLLVLALCTGPVVSLYKTKR